MAGLKKRIMEEKQNKRASKFEKFERIALVLALLKQRVDRVEIAQLLMNKYNIRKSMAYRIIQQATDVAWQQFGRQEIRTIFLEHIGNIRESIRQASKDKQWGAVSSMQQHFSELMGFTSNSSPIQVNINQGFNTEYIGEQRNEIETMYPVARELDNLSKQQLLTWLSRLSLGRTVSSQEVNIERADADTPGNTELVRSDTDTEGVKCNRVE